MNAISKNFSRVICGVFTAMMLIATGAAFAEQVNLNTADVEALQYIPGIGPGKAAEIIRVREEVGGFSAMEDLLAVPGIGEKTLVQVREYGVLDGGVATLTEEMSENPVVRVETEPDGDDSEQAMSGEVSG